MTSLVDEPEVVLKMKKKGRKEEEKSDVKGLLGFCCIMVRVVLPDDTLVSSGVTPDFFVKEGSGG